MLSIGCPNFSATFFLLIFMVGVISFRSTENSVNCLIFSCSANSLGSLHDALLFPNLCRASRHKRRHRAPIHSIQEKQYTCHRAKTAEETQNRPFPPPDQPGAETSRVVCKEIIYKV
jgi:hypothetical protein